MATNFRYELYTVQDNPVLGDMAGNRQRAEAWLRHVVEHFPTVDVVIFPECFLTGYPLQDLVLRPGFQVTVQQELEALAAFVKRLAGPSVIMGAPMVGTPLPFNAAHWLGRNGERQVVAKMELPNTDVFDERRVFSRVTSTSPFQDQGWKIGTLICEDMWHGTAARLLLDEGADGLVVINGSPMEQHKRLLRVAHARRRQTLPRPLLYVNLVGGQDELVFDGHSFGLNEHGPVLFMQHTAIGGAHHVWHRTSAGEVGMVSNLDSNIPASLNVPLALAFNTFLSSKEMDTEHHRDAHWEHVYHTLVVGLHDYVNKSGFEKVLLGLSGGLDSALVAAIAVDALGADRVVTIMMPAQWTGNVSKNLALEMAQRLKCHYSVVPVGDAVQAMQVTLGLALTATALPSSDSGFKIALENLQSRARGQVLMGLSNALPRSLVLSTGNKSEMSVGYATLYGDMCGGFNPIKDLYKTEVQALAAWRNQHRSVRWLGPDNPIPADIITRPPTAELAADQTDEQALGAYPDLDAVLRGLIEHQMSADAIPAWLLRCENRVVTLEYVTRIARLLKMAEYKRRQAPPGIKISARSFGFGWRYPITNHFLL